MTGALVMFSGGQDSTTCLELATRKYDTVETIGFDYGQRHKIELECRKRILYLRYPNVADHVIALPFLRELKDSALTSEAAFAFNANGLPNTFVPARNLIFLSIACAISIRRGLSVIVGGMCETDYSGYPDCRRKTLDAMQEAISLGTETDLTIETPLMWIDKQATWELADKMGILELVRHETHTCYAGSRKLNIWGGGCGDCPACKLRERGYNRWVNA